MTLSVAQPLPRQAIPGDRSRIENFPTNLFPHAAEAYLARYDAVLVRLDRRLEAAMREGLPPDEYPKAEALREANTLARKILRLTVRVDGEARKA